MTAKASTAPEPILLLVTATASRMAEPPPTFSLMLILLRPLLPEDAEAPAELHQQHLPLDEAPLPLIRISTPMPWIASRSSSSAITLSCRTSTIDDIRSWTRSVE